MARNESIGAPSGFHSPYSSTTLTPSASKARSMSSGRSLLAACELGVCPIPTVSLVLSTRLSFGISALNRRCLIWSHTIMTAEQVLAVELEPPATGADLVTGDFDAGPAVTLQAHPRRGRPHVRRIAGGGAAISDQPVAVGHRFRLAVAVGPAKG